MQQKLGRYVIEERLGEGSFAWVYRALDEELDRRVAVKVLKPVWMSDPQALARFKQEARTMAKLIHPSIAVVYEVGEAEGQVFLAQFLVDGETLADRLARAGAMSWPEVLQVVQPVASALDYAHSQGMIHRDIKPANILLDKKGRAFLGDFGLVRAAEGSASISASIAGVKGTGAYIPPEVWDGEEATPVTDVYALSCVVFEMLTGAVLFEGSSMMAVMRQHDRGPQLPDSWPAGIPAGVNEILKRGLARNPAERFQSAGALAEAMAGLESGAGVEKAMPGAGAAGLAAVPTPVEAEQVAAKPLAAEQTETGRQAAEKAEAERLAATMAAATPLVAPIAASTPPASHAQPAKKKGLPLPALIGGVVALLLIAGIGIFFVSGGGGGTPTPAAVPVVAKPEPTATPTEEPTPEPTEAIVAATEEPTPTPEPAEPTATPTEEPTSTPEPTEVIVAATEEPTPTPEPAEPTATPTEEPTPTPEPAEPTATPTEEPTVAPAVSAPTQASEAAAPLGIFEDFESESTWKRGDQPNGEFSRTSAQVSGGSFAGQLAYNFPSPGNDFVVFLHNRLLAGQPAAILAQVYGDGAGHFLSVWIKDSQGEVWGMSFGQINHTGWQQMTAGLSPSQPWPSGHISGPENGLIDYPITFQALVLDDGNDGFVGSGVIYVDDLTSQ